MWERTKRLQKEYAGCSCTYSSTGPKSVKQQWGFGKKDFLRRMHNTCLEIESSLSSFYLFSKYALRADYKLTLG